MGRTTNQTWASAVSRSGSGTCRDGVATGVLRELFSGSSSVSSVSSAEWACGVSVAAREDLRSHHRGLGFLVRHPPHAVHVALRLLDE